MDDYIWQKEVYRSLMSQPKKLIAKIPMNKIVIDEEHQAFSYSFSGNRVIYILIGSLFPEK